ncbi:hypothetical protein E2562_036399 [Oryza meyeriana var. granulata]|uniref:Uncharacterized protein n=1 Tax=Oryza meyeriana var. granulata TaxID=110450 RepID=A0A6G1E898_9ORYZ|nr:hypothetical protein E2562_036399 [Oryza meyeriana var. granulata]
MSLLCHQLRIGTLRGHPPCRLCSWTSARSSLRRRRTWFTFRGQTGVTRQLWGPAAILRMVCKV